MPDPPTRGCFPVTLGSTPRSQARRDASKRGGLACRVVAERLFGQLVEFTARDVAFQLAIPHRPVEFLEPSAELGQFLLRERLDLPFNLFNLAHDPKSSTDDLRHSAVHSYEVLLADR